MQWFKQKETIGLFMIHGFLGNPDTSYGNLSEILKLNNIGNYYFARVQAHDRNDDINDFNYEKAIERIKKDYIYFKSQYDKVYIIGFSMGGALATYLASELKCDKLVLIAPALKYGGTKKLRTNIKLLFKNSKSDQTLEEIVGNDGDVKALLGEYLDSEDGDLDLSAGTIGKNMKTIKPSVIINFMKLIASVKKSIKEVECPTRIFISEHDELVPIDSAFYTFEKVTNVDKRIIILTKAKHRILASSQRYEVLKDIFYFLYGKEKIKWPKSKKSKKN